MYHNQLFQKDRHLDATRMIRKCKCCGAFEVDGFIHRDGKGNLTRRTFRINMDTHHCQRCSGGKMNVTQKVKKVKVVSKSLQNAWYNRDNF